MERYVQKTSQKKNRNDFTGKHLEKLLRGVQSAAPGVSRENGGKPPKGSKGETKKGAKSRAQSVARDDPNADAAPAPKGGGKGGKSDGKSSTGIPFNQICYHHHHGGCKRGKDCKFKHVQLTDEV